jgi:RNA polymerase sigma factor (sigma-70 family)
MNPRHCDQYSVVTFFGHAQVLQRFRQGEAAALDEIYRGYVDSIARAVVTTLRRYGGVSEACSWQTVSAEVPDLVQEVFARAFEPKARGRYEEARDYGAYLRQIARNVTVDHLRHRGRYLLAVPSEIFERPSTESAATSLWANGVPEVDQIDDCADRDTMTIINLYLAGLPDGLRSVHDAVYVRGLSQRQAAEALGIGRQTIRTLEKRLKDGLRAKLARADRAAIDLTAAATTASGDEGGPINVRAYTVDSRTSTPPH